MGTNYNRGRSVEYKAIKTLERAGYLCIRAAGSLGLFDVVAFSCLGVRLIRIKRTRDDMSPEELETIREQLRLLRVPFNVTKELWVWRDREGWVRREVI